MNFSGSTAFGCFGRYGRRGVSTILSPNSANPEHIQEHELEQRGRDRLFPAEAEEHRYYLLKFFNVC